MVSRSNFDANERAVVNAPRQRPSIVRVLAAFCAAVIGFGLLMGYMMLQKRNAQQFADQQPQKTAAVSVTKPPAAQIFEDDAMLRGANAVIGGAVRNISSEPLQDLSLELELRRRRGAGTEARTVTVSPSNLASGETGRYSLVVPSREWIGARVTRLQNGAGREEIAFTVAPGARRPPERPSQGKPAVVRTPRSVPKGEEFINTPDNPMTVR